jgi:DNA-binding MarR family transcriptional regulator
MSANEENLNKILSLDKLIHEPARLAIMTSLMTAESGDFNFILNVTGLTKGNLSSHMEKLSQAGLLKIEKSFIAKKTNTVLSLTDEGKKTIREYWKTIEDLGKKIRN